MLHSTFLQLKRVCQVIPEHTQPCRSFTGPLQWLKLLSQSFLALKQASTCFSSTSSMVNSALSGQSSTYTGLHELHRTFTVVKTAFSIFPDATTNLQVLHSTSWAVKTALSGLSHTYTGLHELHRTFTVVKTAFSIFVGT